jgi:hypothetical protein
MDFHLLEAKKPRSILKQQLKGEFVGQDPENVPGQRVSQHWARRAVRIMQDLGLGKPKGETRYDPYASYRRQIFEILNQMEQKNGEGFMNALNDQQLKTSIRTLAKNISLSRDIPSKDPKLSSVITGNYGGVLTHRAGYVDIDGNTVVDMPTSARHVARATELDKPQHMGMQDLQGSKNPVLKDIHHVLSQDKFDINRDKAVVFSIDNKPFYFLGHVTKTVKIGAAPEKYAYNLLIPRAMYNRAAMNKLGDMVAKEIEVKHTEDYGWLTKWHRLWKTPDLAKLQDGNKEIVIKGKVFDDVVLQAQKLAWEKSKRFFAAQKAYLSFFKKLKHLSDKEREEGRNYLEQEIKKMGEEFSWYLWLLANEYQFGIQVPERRTLNLNLPTTQNTTATEIKHSTIQPVGREDTPSWNLSSLTGLGFAVPRLDKFEKQLQASNYNLGYQGNKATTHLWMPLVDLEREGRLHGVKFHPTNISDYLRASKRKSETEYIVGTEGGEISVKKKLPFPQFNITIGGKEYALVPAVEYLRHFDSPAHGGDRLIHGKGVIPAKLPVRSWVDIKSVNPAPGIQRVVSKGTYIHDPETIRANRPDPKEVMARLGVDRERIERQKARAKEIEARKNLVYVEPGQKKFTGFSHWGTRIPIDRGVSKGFRVRAQQNRAFRTHTFEKTLPAGNTASVTTKIIDVRRPTPQVNLLSKKGIFDWRSKAAIMITQLGIKDFERKKEIIEKMRDPENKIFFLKTSRAAVPKEEQERIKKYLADREALLSKLGRDQLRAEVITAAKEKGFIK